MTWEPRPLPEVTPETEAFWSAATDGEFRVSECGECGLVYHYPRALCPDCFSDDVTLVATTGKGEVYAYSTTQRVPGWPEAALPLVIAYVELDEGPRVMTNLVECDPGEIEVGMRVAARFEPTNEDDVAIPVFAPE